MPARRKEQPLQGVDELPSGKWRARWYESNGERPSQTFDTVEAANAHVITKRTEVAAGTSIDARRGRQLFASYAREWAAAQDWKDTTRECAPRVLARLDAVLPRRATLASVDQLTIKRARIELGKKYAPNTVTLTMSYLNAIMRSAYETRRIAYDPTIGSRSQRRRSRDLDRVNADAVPTRVEVLAILEATPSRYRAAIALGICGLRIGEVLGLTVDRVDLEAERVTIDRQAQRIGNEMKYTTPKNEKVRTIKVPAPVAVELRRHPRDLRGGGLLFVTPRSGRMLRRSEFYVQAWRPALVGAGLAPDRYKFHGLRHFCASSMLAEGVNPMAVAGHLGDTLETLQRVYSHWMRDDRDMPGDALESILHGSPLGHKPDIHSQE